jgi:hypothetical protein
LAAWHAPLGGPKVSLGLRTVQRQRTSLGIVNERPNSTQDLTHRSPEPI